MTDNKDYKIKELEYKISEQSALIKTQANDVRKMVFIRQLLERANRAEMNETTTDRFIVREVKRILET